MLRTILQIHFSQYPVWDDVVVTIGLCYLKLKKNNKINARNGKQMYVIRKNPHMTYVVELFFLVSLTKTYFTFSSCFVCRLSFLAPNRAEELQDVHRLGWLREDRGWMAAVHDMM